MAFCGKDSETQRSFHPFRHPEIREKEFPYIQGKFWKIKEAMDHFNELSLIAPKNYDVIANCKTIDIFNFDEAEIYDTLTMLMQKEAGD